MLDRAREFVQVAQLALANDLYNGCATCCYYAMFWASVAALEHEGIKEPKWSHGGLKQRFTNELIRKRSRYRGQFGTWLSNAYELRLDACYDPDGVSIKRTRRLLDHASEFVARVEEVINI